jgi:hypothetical protein
VTDEEAPPLSAALDHYGVQYRQIPGWQTVVCVFHSETRPSLRVNITSGGFMCQACGVTGGNIYAYVAVKEDVAYKDAISIVGGWPDVEAPKSASGRRRPGRRGYVPRYRRHRIE